MANNVDEGQTALPGVASEEMVEETQKLLSKGANIPVKDKAGNIPWHCAAGAGNVNLHDLLFKDGAEFNLPVNMKNSVDADGQTALHRVAREGMVEDAQKLLFQDANIQVKDKHLHQDGNMPSHCDLLLKEGAGINGVDNSGHTPRILSSGNVNMANKVDECQTGFHGVANEEKTRDNQKLLSQGANIHVKDKGHDMLLKKAAEVNVPVDEGNVVDTDGQTALHRVAMEGTVEDAQKLLSQGANIHVKDKDGNTPLHCAARVGNVNLCDLLVKEGAEINVADNNGYSPVMIAGKHKHKEVVRNLISHGANLSDLTTNVFARASPELDMAILDGMRSVLHKTFEVSADDLKALLDIRGST